MTEAWKQWEGQVVDGQFTLREFLGRSDHSAVFQTTYGPYSQTAALKFVEATPASAPAQLASWERAAKLEHPHLLRLFHWGRCQLGNSPMLYVVTELADENLGQILPNRALNPSETEYMLRSVLEVLGYLHGAGYAHGRLKPGNIMAVSDDLRLSCDTICRAGEKDGTPHQPSVYDAPELVTSGSTPAGDMWSLGITLVEALTQRASPAEAVRTTDPALPETIPAPFSEIARQCLRLDPQRRWTVPDIAARLLPPATPPKKSRAGYMAASILALALAGFFVVPKLLHQSSAPVKQDAPTQVKGTEATSDPPPGDRKSELVRKETSKPGEAPREKASAPPPAHVASPVKNGTATSASSSGAVAEQVLPKVSQRSLNTITGKVKVTVRVVVDGTGKVSSASLQSAGPSEYFSRVALDASRHWKFSPPQSGGEAVPSQWLLHYAFGKRGVEVHPAQVSQ